MVNQTTFGRRTTPLRQPLRAMEKFDPIPPSTKSVFAEVSVDQSSAMQSKIAPPDIDHELSEWKQARKQRSKIPWRQLSLMGSLCFGIASFVLPDSVNENLDWLLYGLMAASLYAGLSRRWGV
jgi:hypothetical protein